jgi:ornithine cyclodeaminase/alanine dehydrogenase-like protein (mu-crystallin family)
MADLLYLSRADVERIGLDMPALIGLLGVAFAEKARGGVEMPPKPGIHPRPDAFIHAMPASVAPLGAAGIKWVSGYPQNTARGLPYISGLIVLNDPDTGIPVAVMDCTWITAHRTGAATALAARFLARPDSRAVGILACGVQGRTNLLALAALFPVERVFAYDVDGGVQERYVRDMSAALGVDVVGVTDPRDAVVSSDMVVTSGPILRHPNPTIDADWLAPGSFASAVDFDSYWTARALRQFDVIATDDLAQFEYYRRAGYFGETPTPHLALEDLVSGARPGRTSDHQRTLALNLGLALEDVVVAQEVYRRARDLGIGTKLAL